MRTLCCVAAALAAPAMITAARGGTDFTFALVAASLVGGAGLAYCVGDDAAVVLAPTPVSLARRRAVRLGATVAVFAVGWLITAAAVQLSSGSRRVSMSSLAVCALTAAGLGVACAALLARKSMDTPGLGGAAISALTMLSCTALAFQYQWLPRLDPGADYRRWYWVAIPAWAAAAWASRDPAVRPLRRG